MTDLELTIQLMTLKQPRRYLVGYDHTLPKSDTVTLYEMDEHWQHTGRTWPEPFDPVNGSVFEVADRFEKRIRSGQPPPVMVAI